MADRWRPHCEDVYHIEYKTDPDLSIEWNDFDFEPLILRSEVKTAMHRIKNNKSTCSDGISAELLNLKGMRGSPIYIQFETTLGNVEKITQEGLNEEMRELEDNLYNFIRQHCNVKYY